VVGAAENDLSAEREIIESIQLRATNVAAELPGVPGRGVGDIVENLERVLRRRVWLIDGPAEIGNRRAAGNESAGEHDLRDIAQAERRSGWPSGVEAVGSGLWTELRAQRFHRSGEAEANLIERLGCQYPRVRDRGQVSPAGHQQPESRNVSAAL